MPDEKRRSSQAIPLKKGTAKSGESLHNVKLECERLREALQKQVIDNPQTAKKAALLIGMWIENKSRSRGKKAA